MTQNTKAAKTVAPRTPKTSKTKTTPDVATVPVVAKLLPNLRPADRAVALMALAEAIKAEADTAKAEALELADLTGARSFRTPLGTLSVVQREAKPIIDQAKLLEFVRSREPELIETVEQVKPWAAKVYTDRLVRIDGADGVYDSTDLPRDNETYVVVEGDVFLTDGTPVEPVPFAVPGNVPDPYVSWPTSAEKKSALAGVAAWLTSESTNLARRTIEAGA